MIEPLVEQVVAALEQRGLRVAGINIDGWLNLPQVRFSDTDYRKIYFPAQEIHFARDEPRAAASAILVNDPRLVG